MKTLVLATAIAVTSLAPSARAGTIVDVAAGNGSFTTLVAAVQAAGLAGALSAPGPLTVFAPTDEAFSSLPNGVVEKLLQESNKDLLVQLLTYHVAPGKVMAAQVVTLDEVTTLEGSSLKVKVDEGAVRINNANVVTPDVMADNGVIHVVDRVLLPKSFIGELNRRK